MLNIKVINATNNTYSTRYSQPFDTKKFTTTI